MLGLRAPGIALVFAFAIASCGGGGASGGSVAPILPPSPSAPSLVNVQFTNLGPYWGTSLATQAGFDMVGSGKIQTVVPLGTTTRSRAAQIIYVAGGDGDGFDVPVSAGIYKTTNGGASWAAIGASAGLTDTRVNDLYVAPGVTTAQDVVLAATEFGGIYRSTDGGATFSQVDPNPGAHQFASFNGAIFASDANGVEVSQNGGATWSLFFPISASNVAGRGAFALTSSGTGASARLAVGDVGGNVYVYNGLSWSAGHSVALAGVDCTVAGTPPVIHSLAVDPLTPQIIWATVWACNPLVAQELFLSQDGGLTWTRTAHFAAGPGSGAPPGWQGAQMIGYSTAIPHAIYVGAEFKQWSVLPGSPPVFTPVAGSSASPRAGTYGDMRGLVVVSNAAGGDACYIASDQGLYFQGTCGADGALPTLLTAGLSTNYLYGFAVAGALGGETLLVTTQDFGPAASHNGGASWTGAFGGAAGQSLFEGGDAEISPFDSATCVVANPGYGGVAYSSDGCATFSATAGSPDLANVVGVSFDRSVRGRVYFPADVSGLFVSNDNGQSAMQVSGNAQLLANGRGVYQVVSDPTNAQNLFAVLLDDTTAAESVMYSSDAGASWNASSGINDPIASFPALSVDPSDPTHVVVVAGTPSLAVYQSHDRARTFIATHPTAIQRVQRATNPIFPFVFHFAPPGGLLNSRSPNSAREWRRERLTSGISPQYVHSLAFNPNAPAGTQPLLALGTGFGLFASSDGGMTWSELDGGTNTTTISRRFTKVVWHNGYLYVSTDGQGLLRSTRALQ
jgi:hypothetical protein